jgi:GNAT superfamily N-acetyltransferase/gamma-glutamylcyclotransferase (GGCT)/AIG2-like uncharacterized protein YtfP
MTSDAETHYPVFAYGSNMHLRDLARWMERRELGQPGIARVEQAHLPGHTLVWEYCSPLRGAGAANVAPRGGCEVPGLVLHVDARTFQALDRKEGYPDRYHRGSAPIELRRPDGSRTEGWVYRVLGRWQRAEPIYPQTDYLGLLLEGAREHGLPQWHVERLRRTPTVHPHAGVTVRPAEPLDAPGVASVHVRAWQQSYRALVPDEVLSALSVDDRAERLGSELEQERAGTGRQTWIAERGGRVVGFARSGETRDEDMPRGTLELQAMYVDPDVQGAGVGQALMERLGFPWNTRPLTLWVLEGNRRARRFYEKAGLRPDGVRQTFRVAGFELPVVRHVSSSPTAPADPSGGPGAPRG